MKQCELIIFILVMQQPKLLRLIRFTGMELWAGSRVNLIDKFNNGRYYAHIYDAESNELFIQRDMIVSLVNIKPVHLQLKVSNELITNQ